MDSQYFNPGTQIELDNGKFAEIVEKLGEGGQGIVYRVTLDDKDYALKWYHPKALKTPHDFYNNLNANINLGAPSSAFLWPVFLTKKAYGSFGYVMNLRPSNYRDFGDFLLNRVNFSSITAVINAALSITNGFRELHRKGYSYQDLNDGNFFIDPETGSVLICDNDNVAPWGTNLGIAGKARYMAPEVVRSMTRPNEKSDRFSLAVMLFRLFFLDHPFEGMRVVKAPCLTEELELLFYGTDPVFINDEFNATNRPVSGIHDNVLRIWPLFPSFIHKKFRESFSKEACSDDNKRLTDNIWQLTFTRLRDCTARCPHCHEETFVYPNGGVCINCGNRLPRPVLLKCREDEKYRVVLYPGAKLYRCHIDDCSDDYNEICGTVDGELKPESLQITNRSDIIWNVHFRDGRSAILNPGSSVNVYEVSRLAFSPECEGIMSF